MFAWRTQNTNAQLKGESEQNCSFERVFCHDLVGYGRSRNWAVNVGDYVMGLTIPDGIGYPTKFLVFSVEALIKAPGFIVPYRL
jgi:hypothetical protein